MSPSRGEIWLVDLNPTVGDEMQKTRPAVVISSYSLGILRLRIIVPLTEWKPRYGTTPWMIQIKPNNTNNLDKVSVADAFQVRSISTRRFVRRVGHLPQSTVQLIAAAVAVCTEYK